MFKFCNSCDGVASFLFLAFISKQIRFDNLVIVTKINFLTRDERNNYLVLCVVCRFYDEPFSRNGTNSITDLKIFCVSHFF